MQNLQAIGNTIDKKHQGGATQSATPYDALAKPLGTITKYLSTPINTSFARPHDFILQDQSAKLLPTERVKYCLKNRIDKSKNRSIVYVPKTDKTHWDNVQRCGSLWICPCCAKNITECRRKELLKAKNNWLSETKPQHFNNSLLLLTLTTPHTVKDDLKQLLKQQSKALHYFWGDRLGKKILSAMWNFGFIKSTEVTYGDNGFHPHYHIVLFLRRELTLFEIDTFKKLLFDHWVNCCKKANLSLPNQKHGLDLRDGTFANQYIGKWGIEHELTKSHSKKGKKGSLTPFDLLNLSINDDPINGRKPSYLYKKYAEAFKGKTQLLWSNGLKDYFAINEKDDDDIVKEIVNNSVKIIDVDNQVFYLLRNAKMRHLALDWAKNDFKNGTLDCGEYLTNIFDLLQEKNYISPYAIN
jgi:hypothetical protein